MIKKLRSKLAFKVFCLTLLLLAGCCGITYSCIARFAPYIYSHDVADVEEIAQMAAVELSYASREETPHLLAFFQELLASEYEDEFVLHLFGGSGEEWALPRLDSLTGAHLEDYRNVERTEPQTLFFQEGVEAYTLLITPNTHKESQVVQALEKAVPVLSVVILVMSAIAAFFYTWYMTGPMIAMSRVARQMAALDFSGLCRTRRTDEIGALSESLNELSEKLSAALADLRKVNQQLQADMQREQELEKQRTEFFSAASHELKTPITIIKGQLQGMLYQVGRYRDRDAYLARSLETADNLERRVQELLILSRLGTPGAECRMERVDLSAMVEARLLEYDDLFPQKGLAIKPSVAPDVEIMGDRRLLEQVLDNLLDNAAAYSGAGNEVRVKLWRQDGQASLTVENTGVRIPGADLPQLFEPFYRVEASRSRQTGGTGLGLSIAKAILDQHGARIAIANTDSGVLVSVRFEERSIENT